MKILSPVGDMESLKAAIYNGADEVYLGINGFNARNNISGFNMSSLKEAVDFAHIYNVKVLLAINILFTNEELQSALNTIVDANNLGVDAFIIQDLGLAYLLHTNYPQIELHASTQMGICNLEGASYISQFGFSRIVLARETPLEEIKRIKDNLNIEIEYFVQGALCVSFSGNCYLSSYLCNASGNRGKCKQLCRLPYKFSFGNKKIKDGYLLSAKDFNMLNKLNELQQSGVDVLKIEGRARRPFYVAAATHTYRNAVDKLKYNPEILNIAFSREYTPGYFNGNSNIISNHNNHIGLYVGEIIKVKTGKNFNEIFFKTKNPPSPKSTYKIFQNNKEVGTFTAFSIKQIDKNIYSTTTTQNIPQTGKLHLIVDESLEKDYLQIVKKRKVTINIAAEQNNPIRATFNVNNCEIEIFGDTCATALNQPITKEDIVNSFNKSDFFEPVLNIQLNNIFLTKKQINDFRRSVYTSMISELTKSKNVKYEHVRVNTKSQINPLKDFAIISNFNKLPTNKNIIYSPEKYNISDINKFIDICAQNNKTPILDTPNFLTCQDIAFLKNVINKTKIKIVCNNYSTLQLTDNFIVGAGLNVYNSVSASVFNKEFLTAEQDFNSKIDFPYMTLRHCPMKEHLSASCEACPYKTGFYYSMQNGTKLYLHRKQLFSCTFYLTKEK